MQSPLMCFGIVRKLAEPLLDHLFTRALALALLFSASLLVTESVAQQRYAEVSGLITDALNGQPLQGASILLTQNDRLGYQYGAATDSDGKYRLAQVLAGQYLVTIRFVGYDEEKFRST